jgi:hypothetical protein
MARPTSKLRLRDIDPRTTADECVRALQARLDKMARVLRPPLTFEATVDPSAGDCDLAKWILTLGAYALRGTSLRLGLETLIGRLEPLRACADAVGSLDPAEPVTPLDFLIAGARARAALEVGDTLTSVQLAILAGLDRDHVNGLALTNVIPGAYRSDESRHRPWRYKPTKALREWVAQYTDSL